MPRREGSYTTHGKTKLARLRAARDISLRVAAGLIDMEPSTLWRLEHGLIANPRLGWLVNAAALYDVSLSEVLEDEWLLGISQPVVRRADFGELWGERASASPKPVGRSENEAVALVRPSKKARRGPA